MKAKITKFSLQRKQRFNLGDFHGVEIGLFNVTVEMKQDSAQISIDGGEEKAGFEIELADDEDFVSLAVKVQGMMQEAIRETAQGFKEYVVPFTTKSKNGMMVEVTPTYQGVPTE